MRRKPGRPSSKEQWLGATPETASKLRPDPLFVLLATYGNGDTSLERAADEIRAIYLAVCGRLMAGIGGMGGGKPMSDFIAWAHAGTYLPWAQATNRKTLEAAIDTIVDRHVVQPVFAKLVTLALADYAQRMKSRPAFREEAV